jgi:hypothetical protein
VNSKELKEMADSLPDRMDQRDREKRYKKMVAQKDKARKEQDNKKK